MTRRSPFHSGHLFLFLPAQWLYFSSLLAFSCPVSSRQIQQKFFLHFPQFTRLQVSLVLSILTLCTTKARKEAGQTRPWEGGGGTVWYQPKADSARCRLKHTKAQNF